MIPQGGQVQNRTYTIQQQPSYTYRLDLRRKRVIGMIDNLEAIKQAIYKILLTERFYYMIYSFNYGSEITPLIGSNRLFFESEIKRRVREALMQDDRITNVQQFEISYGEGSALVKFVVITEFGSFPASREVMI